MLIYLYIYMLIIVIGWLYAKYCIMYCSGMYVNFERRNLQVTSLD
jgi:hypothetical protein